MGWKIILVDGPPVDGRLCIGKYDRGKFGWFLEFVHYTNYAWCTQNGEKRNEPNYYNDNWN